MPPRQSSVGPAGRRSGIDKAHVPYRGENPFVGKRTGIAIELAQTNSDGFEDFGVIMQEQYKAVEAKKSSSGAKRKVKNKKKQVEEEEEDDLDGEMSMDVDSPVQNIRVPNTPRQGRPSGRASRFSQVDFDQVPSPRPLANRRLTPGPGSSPLKRTLNAKEFLARDEGLSSDDENFAEPAYNDYQDDDDDGPKELSFTEMHDQVDTDDIEIPPQPVLSSSPRKGKRKAPDPDDEEELNTTHAMDLDLPPSDEEQDTSSPPPPPQRSPPKKKARPTTPEPEPDPEPSEDEDNQPLSPQQPRSPPKKKTKTKPDKPKNIIIKSRGQKENRDVPKGVRRSQRVPIAPLEWWRLEKYEYGGREDADAAGPMLVPHIRAIVRVPKDPVVPLGSKKRSNNARRRSSTPGSSKSKVKIVEKIVEVHVDSANPEEGWDDDTNTQALVNSYPDGEPVKRRIAFTSKMFAPTSAGNSQWSYQRIFGDGDFIAAGQIVIPPNGRKPSKPSKDNTFIFYVIQGAVNLKICDTSLIIAAGGMFMIPRGNTYFIENIAERDAKLFFTQARKTRDGEAAADQEDGNSEAVVSAGKGKPARAVSLANPTRETSKEVARRGKSLNV
ncbi:CENP-C-C domain-containing protein [Mycena indigotica]|uniref:CENP-C homolog n=1 Tax=Mycena indigotica TaxID=2126181 RepID=A0A8H6T2W3_9AGAR|nr:CENP-C-C domain-containing protein [Mycena indigotica]KAF7309889.1 CENP-C-C domain-containing protein [Mycena indigotica]